MNDGVKPEMELGLEGLVLHRDDGEFIVVTRRIKIHAKT
jgi:hypothetical protein